MMRRALALFGLCLIAQFGLATAAYSADPAAPVVFRLGNAAGPFGWSTVIADFNADGAPDVAVADEVGRGAGGYAFTLEVDISGRAPYQFTFESPEPNLGLSIADVDADDDPDIVVSVPLSRRPVGVWLNDGRGHFLRGETRPALPTSTPTEEIRVSHEVQDATLSILTSPRDIAGFLTECQPFDDVNDPCRVLVSAHWPHHATGTAPAPPRAPPA